MYTNSSQTSSDRKNTVGAGLPDCSRFSPDRRKYTKVQLIAIRSDANRSRPFTDTHRARLGSVASLTSEPRWTFVTDADGTHSYRNFRANGVHVRSSLLPSRDDLFLQRNCDGSHHSARSAEFAESQDIEAGGSADLTISSLSQASHGNTVGKRASRFLASNRNDQFSRSVTSAQTESEKAGSSHLDRRRNSTTSLSQGLNKLMVPETKRRFASPNRSPQMSPEPSPSGSCPPGFGPPAGYRNMLKNPTRNPANMSRDSIAKSRICRGPNMDDNFRTRTDFHAANAVSVEADIRNPQRDDVDQAAVQGASGENFRVLSTHTDAPENLIQFASSAAAGSGHQVVDRDTELATATMDKRIPSETSFEEFSRRLAVETGSLNRSTVTDEVSVDPQIFPNENVGQETQVVYEWGGNGKREPPLDQAAVDALSKWFGRVAQEQNPLEMLEGSSQLRSIAKSMTPAIPLSGSQLDKEELDATLLPFFDSIRTQALHEKPVSTSVVNNHSSNHTLSGDLGSSTDYGPTHDETHGSDPIRSGHKDSWKEKSTEVEQFFQLFTEGKSVCRKQLSPIGQECATVAVPKGNPIEDTSTVDVSDHLNDSCAETDNGGLEKWFAALAKGGQLR